ncbi:hypothetical protein C4A74_03666 [Escherichia coli]|nr:hypothetical protein C4A74_03666 [Escherichia coli]RDQ11425.1 hypothetical protein C4A37_03338 [Escherichia coli]
MSKLPERFGCLVTQLVVAVPAQHHRAGTVTMYDGFTVMVVTMRPLAGFNMTQQPVRQCTSAASSTNHPFVTEKWQQCFVFRQRLANGRNDSGWQTAHAFRFRLYQYTGMT